MAVDIDGRGGDVVPLLTDRFAPESTRAYVCRDFVCELPSTEPGEMERLLELRK
jgi:uncharacterized protein YyaL (SSP411 family)